MNDLDTLIQRLALPHDAPVTRHGQLIGHRRRRPLLTVLGDTAAPSSGGPAGFATTGPRIAIDPATTELHAGIHQELRDWALAAGVQPGPYFVTGERLDWSDPAQLLLAWRSITDPDRARTRVPQLLEWVHAISDLVIDPPKRISLDAECPRCHQRWAEFTRGSRKGERVDALQITMRDPATDSETDSRNCGARWLGLDGAEALQEEFHRLEHVRHLISCAGTTSDLHFEPWLASAYAAARARIAAAAKAEQQSPSTHELLQQRIAS